MHVGVVGAGPIGLYAAFKLCGKHKVILWEAEDIASNVEKWGFVTLFSSMSLNLPTDLREALEATGTTLPSPDEYLTGSEFRSRVLEPVAAYLKAHGVVLRTGARVTGVGRDRLLKGEGIVAIGDNRRKSAPFRVVVNEDTHETCDVLVDASGSYGNGLWCGVGGTPALGEKQAEAQGHISRIIPEPSTVTGRVAIVGSGYSAVTTLKNLYGNADVLWLLRRTGPPYARLDNDPLPQRDALAAFGNGLHETKTDSNFECLSGAAILGVKRSSDGLCIDVEIEAPDGTRTVVQRTVDHLYSLTGYKPDANLLSEIHMHACYASDGPIKLAATLLGGGGGDCLAQAAPGAATLENPEPSLFIIGQKSYGRNSAFLMRIGYEQVDLLYDVLTTSV